MEINTRYNFALAIFLTIFSCCFSSPIASKFPQIDSRDTQHTISQLTPNIIYTLPNSYQAENIKPRGNGKLLITTSSVPELYQFDPNTQAATLIATIPGYTSLFGITETYTDVFYVTVGNFSGPPNYYGTPNTGAIFQIDLRINNTKVTKIVDVPHAELLDGLATITNNLLVTADAQTGVVYLINIKKNTATSILTSPLLAGLDDVPSSSLNHIGINGIKYHNGGIHFTNTAKFTYGVIPINHNTGLPTGQPEILSDYGVWTDDMNFDYEGNAFISEPLYGIIYRPAITNPFVNQTQMLVELGGANSNAFGRTARDRCILYSTFAGVPSGVVRIDTGGRFCGCA